MVERFEWEDGALIRTIDIGAHRATQRIEVERTHSPAADVWDSALLRGIVPQSVAGGGRGRVRVVDLFCGAGGLTLGVVRGLESLGYSPVVEFAADMDRDALALYDKNFGPVELHHGDVDTLVQASVSTESDSTCFSHRPWVRDRRLAARLSGADILIGGPPCQGHSNLNNHTRRSDPRNALYLAMPAVAVALDIPIVIIENVREVRRDHQGVVTQATDLLRNAGYSVADGVLSGLKLGLPQTRHRYFLIAVKGPVPNEPQALAPLLEPLSRPPRDLAWAIGDLNDRPFGGIHSPAELSPENVRRIAYLFDNDLYELPDAERPGCHRNGHTYRSVYGRLRWDQPSGTITTGFLTPGRGRYIHPSQRRALTPHEAARIQGFPDSFSFKYSDGVVPAKKTLAKVIGDAVPPAMGEAAVLVAMQLKQAENRSGVDAAA